MQELTPKRIEPFSSTEICIGWSDGTLFSIPYFEIRFQCPCAICVDEMTGKRTLKRENVRADVKPQKVEQVGRYAVQIKWSDGHGTGIFHYEKLMELCQKNGRLIGNA